MLFHCLNIDNGVFDNLSFVDLGLNDLVSGVVGSLQSAERQKVAKYVFGGLQQLLIDFSLLDLSGIGGT